MQGVYTVYAYTLYTRCMHVYTRACIYGAHTVYAHIGYAARIRVCSPYTLYTAYTVYIGKYPYIQALYRACI